MKKNTPRFLLTALAALAVSVCPASRASSSQQTPNLMSFQKQHADSSTGERGKNNASSLEPANRQGASATYGGYKQAGTEGSGKEVQTNAGDPQSQKEKPSQSGAPVDEVAPGGYTEVPKYQGLDHLGPKTPADPPGSTYHPPQHLNVKFGSQQADKSHDYNQANYGKGGGTIDSVESNYINKILGAAKFADEVSAPSNFVQTAKAVQEAQAQQASGACAEAAEGAMAEDVIQIRQTLINVANEGVGVPTTTYAPVRLLSQAIWMVQQMFKHVYIPMAILLVLPGAVLTQVKCVAAAGMIDLEDEDTMSPFTGILRAVIAIFLIPATQLIVSFAIDIGNSMTFEVQKYIVPAQILVWAKEQTFNPPSANEKNSLGGGTQQKDAGKMTDVSENSSGVENQSSATNMMQMGFNFMNMALGFGMTILLAFQIVMMCYLMLMGPIAAALFAWPTNTGSLFSKVFANWVDAVTNLALWRFWWCVVLLCICTRISWLTEIGEFNPNSQWEMLVFTAFMVILTYVPFMPFDYKPGEMVAKVLEKASEAQKGAGGGGGAGAGGGAGGAGEGASGGGGSGGGSSDGDGGGASDGGAPSGGEDNISPASSRFNPGPPAPSGDTRESGRGSGNSDEELNPPPRAGIFVAGPPSAGQDFGERDVPPPPMTRPTEAAA